MKRKPLPLLILILLICAGFGATVRAEQLPVKIYTSADGLGTSAIFRVVRDTRGFIWFCSRDGLIRFDGHSFITYKIGADGADPSVFSMLPTREGVYWINLNRGQDYRFVEKDSSQLLEPIQQQLAKTITGCRSMLSRSTNYRRLQAGRERFGLSIRRGFMKLATSTGASNRV